MKIQYEYSQQFSGFWIKIGPNINGPNINNSVLLQKMFLKKLNLINILPYWWVVLMVMSLLVIGHLTGVMNFFHFSGTPCTIFVEIWLVRW